MQILSKAHGHAKRHYEKHYKTRYQERAHLVFLLDAALVSIALGLLGLGCYLRWYYHPLRDNFQLSLVTDQKIDAGKEMTFAVRVVNSGKFELHDAALNVRLPSRFIVAETPNAYDAKTGELTIGTMNAHTSHEYRFRGTLIGLPQESDLYVRLTAKDREGDSDEKLTKGILRWEGNAIETRFEAPEAVVPGQATTFAIRVKNGTSFTFEDAAIVPKWPEGFRLQNATPPVYRGAIALGRLEAGEETVVKFSGRFTGLTDLLRFSAVLNGTLHDQPYTLATAKSDVRMATVDLKLEAAFAGDAPKFVRPGQEIPVVLRYRNEGKQTIKNLTLDIAPDANTISGTRWETSAHLDAIPAGESGERTVFVRVRDSVSRYVVNPMLRVVPQATFSIDDPKIVDARVAGTPIETKISGSAKLRAAARYYTSEGDQLGRGPLPPKVGKATRYWMFASLETGAAETRDGVVTFQLPSDVTFTGRSAVTAGQDLALEGSTLTWRIGTIDAHAGELSEAPSASFELSLTPTPEQVGTSPLLLSNASYTGTDTWTGEALSSHQAGLTTQLPGDPAVSGRTQVRP